MLKGLDNVSLSVKDLNRSVAYYRDVLGMEVQDSHGDNIIFVGVPGAKSTNIMLQRRENPVPGNGYITLAVDDVNARKPELDAKGAIVTGGPFPIPGVGMGLDMQDPDGNQICLIDYTQMK